MHGQTHSSVRAFHSTGVGILAFCRHVEGVIVDFGEAVFILVSVGGLALWEVLTLILFVGVAAFLIVVHLAAFIAVSAPAGGLVCLLFHLRRKGGYFREGLLGAARWACWFLPWLHYVLYGRRGRPAPVWLVWSGYSALFLVWLAGPIAGGFALAELSSADPLVQDSWLRYLLYLLPVANIAGLGWSVIMVASKFRKYSFGVLGAYHMAPFGLCMAGCLVAYLCSPVKLIG